ncbi:MAG: tetratricopeptide repeat protein, partial [Anaerolineaceae bacterium]|nr:tetratricopeptide repeat protein [Anaerolineaceae bacterium]
WRVTVSLTDMAGNVTTAWCEVLVKAAPRVAEAAPEETADNKLTVVSPLQPMVEPTTPTQATGPTTEPGGDDQAPETEAPAAAPAVPGDRQLEPAGQVLARERIAVLGSRLLSIGYTWDTEHPPQRIGLWVTSDGGRTWKLDHVAERLTGTFVFQAPADGAYGFRTHRELGSSTWGKPQSGTAPEREVIVDTVAPKVEWIGALVAQSTEAHGIATARVTGQATLRWLAVDENLAERPARLDYREFGKTRWHLLAADLPGDGSYQWSLPEGLSGDVEVRVTVADRAGQIAAADLRLKVVPPAQPADPGPDTAATKPDEKAIAEARRAYAMATLARLREDWAEAERQLKRATTLNPDHSRAWVDLGGVHAHNGQWDQAAAVYTRAVELQPDNSNALFGLARAQVARGNSGGAMRALESLLARRPTDGDALVLYGDLQWKAGRRDEARQSWLRALDAGGGSQAKLAAIQRRLKLKH